MSGSEWIAVGGLAIAALTVVSNALLERFRAKRAFELKTYEVTFLEKQKAFAALFLALRRLFNIAKFPRGTKEEIDAAFGEEVDALHRLLPFLDKAQHDWLADKATEIEGGIQQIWKAGSGEEPPKYTEHFARVEAFRAEFFRKLFQTEERRAGMTPRQRITWAGIAVVALGLGFVLGGSRRPAQEGRAWNTNALRAKFTAGQLEGEQGHQSPLFFYELENTTSEDYSLEKVTEIELMLREKGVLDNWMGEALTLDLPLFVPAHQKATVRIHFKLSDIEQPSGAMTKDEVRAFLISPRRYWNQNKTEGFVLFDKRRRYQVDFPMIQ